MQPTEWKAIVSKSIMSKTEHVIDIWLPPIKKETSYFKKFLLFSLFTDEYHQIWNEQTLTELLQIWSIMLVPLEGFFIYKMRVLSAHPQAFSGNIYAIVYIKVYDRLLLQLKSIKVISSDFNQASCFTAYTVHCKLAISMCFYEYGWWRIIYEWWGR